MSEPITPPTAPAAGPTAEDLEHLRLLSVFHYVVGGLAALVASIPLFHVVLGAMMASGQMGADGPEAILGCFFMALGGSLVALGWGYAAAMIVAAKALAERRRYTLCLVMAAISCAFTPFGTILGIFTLIVLMRPSVKAAFEAHRATSAAVAV